MYPAILLSNLVLIAIGCVIQYDQAAKTVPMDRPKLYVALSTVVTVSLWAFNNCLLDKGSSVIDVIIISTATLSTVIFASDGNKWKGALAMVVYMALQIAVMYVVALFAYPIAEKLGFVPDDLVNKRTSFGNAIMVFICLCILAPAIFLCRRLLVRLFRGGELSHWLLYFLPIPISQTILMNILNRVLPFANGIDGIQIAYVLAALFAFAADVGFFIGIRRIQQGNQLKEQVRLVNEQLDVQTGYYRQLQNSILAVNQIRHDLNNQLQAAYHLLEKGETAQVRQQLDLVRDSLCERVGPQYSSNLMVDAVLQDKARHCRDNGIRLTVSAELPWELPIENAHVCSAFSNLLDNSIRGALESGVKEPEIHLQALVRNNCLVIRCTNSASHSERKQNADPLRSHGLGLEILARIASQYCGSLNTGFQDGQFDATLILRFPQPAEEKEPV